MIKRWNHFNRTFLHVLLYVINMFSSALLSLQALALASVLTDSPVLELQDGPGVQGLGRFPWFCVGEGARGHTGAVCRLLVAVRGRSPQINIPDSEGREEEQSRQEAGLAVLRHVGWLTVGVVGGAYCGTIGNAVILYSEPFRIKE